MLASQTKPKRRINCATNLQAALFTPHPDPFYTPRYLLHIRLLKVGLESRSDL